WRSIRDLREGEKARPEQLREFPIADPGKPWVELGQSESSSGVGRRDFMTLMGASVALAGTTGCIRKDVQHILPYTDRPEDLIPGQARYYRTAMAIGENVVGLHVASVDGRPTKVEGSPDHPLSRGKTNRWNQASVINLYDPDRSQKVRFKGEESTPEKFAEAMATLMREYQGGGGLGVVVDGTPSPTLWRLLTELTAQHGKASIYRHDLCWNRAQADGLELAGLAGHSVFHKLEDADVVVSLDSDFLGGDGDTVIMSNGFSKRRHPKNGTLNRLYVAEPGFSVTGAMADHRVRLPASHLGEFLRGIAGAVSAADAPAAVKAQVADRKNTEPGGLTWSERFEKFVTAIGKDLAGARGRSVVIVGERQPAWVHGLAAFVNEQLGNVGKTVFYTPLGRPALPGLEALAADIGAGKLSAVLLLGTSPVYDAPADLDIASKLKTLKTVVHLGYYADETAALATWHAPIAHHLESWGDLVSSDGTVAMQQPLIAPLFDPAQSVIELLSRLLADASPMHQVVRKTNGLESDWDWRRAVHDGIVKKGEAPTGATFSWDALVTAMNQDKGPTKPGPGALEVVFQLDQSVLDGRYANTGWLQELPNPITKITWDNCAFLSPATAKALGVEDSGVPESDIEVKGQLVEVALGGRKIEIVAWVLPGVTDGVVILPTGYGREIGGIAKGAGFNVMPLRTAASPWFAYGATLTKLNKVYSVATTQEYGTMVDPLKGHKRPIVRENTVEGYKADPNFVEKDELLPRDALASLWTPPNATDGQQWGMTIDLSTCTGCNVCTIACQAENNIPIVGKERVMNGREMHWIRLDRYFTGTEDEPSAVVQPVACAQCEMAPCENVCPVAATTHSPEGLNDMAYNRCIGTRYCTNNCPFKVRRFNFFNYNKERSQAAPLEGLQHNPNVTVRFRGVVEKCTYCVQRINEAKVAVKRQGQSTVPDGAIVPACVQACPSESILFGDLNDPNAKVTLSKQEPRNYELLRDLNLHARTSFLAKIRNPNRELV
ncbi:MAG: 4Fe-4S dicluster domain-containing protein, partial [Myxococcales bacterium]|nr:4Fe-4S dicluster domain-containing protein [Myxococcales bacterium]